MLVFLTGSALKADSPNVPSHYQVVSFDVHLALEGSHCVNRSGVVVGTVYVQPKPASSNNFQAYQWKNGVLHSLKVFEKNLPSNSPIAINDDGQIVGTLMKDTGEMNFHSWGHAFLWERGKWQDLSNFIPDEVSYAKAINNKGEVAISAQTSSMYNIDDPAPEKQHSAYLYRKGRGIFFLGHEEVNALNNKSQALLSEQGHYYLWNNGKTTDIRSPDISDFTFHDMNDKSQIIGHCRKGAVLYANTHFTFLDQAHESYAQSINNNGQVVGYFYLPRVAGRSVQSRAFLWQKGRLHNLDSLVSPKAGWVFEEATSINDRGQIVGRGTHWGKPFGFLMTPIHER